MLEYSKIGEVPKRKHSPATPANGMEFSRSLGEVSPRQPVLMQCERENICSLIRLPIER